MQPLKTFQWQSPVNNNLCLEKFHHFCLVESSIRTVTDFESQVQPLETYLTIGTYYNMYVYHPRVTVVLLCISASFFWFHSHDFASIWRLLCSPPYVLQTFSHKPAALSKQDSLLKSSVNGLLGGGCSQIPWMVIQPYAVSTLSNLEDSSHVHFVALVEKVGIGVEAYPNDQFIHADIPLKIAMQLLSVTITRCIASSHGISVGSHCNFTLLSLLLAQHECTNCLSYLIIFSVGSDSNRKKKKSSTIDYV